MWTDRIVQRFKIIPLNPRENDYYAPYNKLLNYVFPPDTDFTVVPQSYPVPESRDSIDFVIEYLIEIQNRPVLILEIKSPNSIKFLSKRQEADNQIRRRLRDIVDLCPLERLYGVSAFGTDICIYNIDKNYEIIPERIPEDRKKIIDTAPRGQWSIDILTQEGSSMLEDIFSYIKSNV